MQNAILPDLEKVSLFRFYNLKGFNWMFKGSFLSADNNQQIVEGIAWSFSGHSGVRLERVQSAIAEVKNISEANSMLMLYTTEGSPLVRCTATAPNSQLHQMFYVV